MKCCECGQEVEDKYMYPLSDNHGGITHICDDCMTDIISVQLETITEEIGFYKVLAGICFVGMCIMLGIILSS